MIFIHKSDSTIFADQKKFLTFKIKTDYNLTGWKAVFCLCSVKKTIEDISAKTFDVILSDKDTSKLYYGKPFGEIKLIDKDGNIKTISNDIPFCVTNGIVENEAQTIDLDIPKSEGISISVSYAGSGGTSNYEDLENKPSINDVELIGNKTLDALGIQPKGNYLEEHQDISHLATKTELTQGLETKQPKGNYLTAHQDISHLASKEEVAAGLDVKANVSDLTFDWIGTKAEYEAGISNGTIKNNWLCYITDDEQDFLVDVPTIKLITQTDYDALATKQANTLYLIEE